MSKSPGLQEALCHRHRIITSSYPPLPRPPGVSRPASCFPALPRSPAAGPRARRRPDRDKARMDPRPGRGSGAGSGSMPITTLAVRIRAFCASTRRADGDRWLDPGLAAGPVSRGNPGGPWTGTGGAAPTWPWTRSGGSAPGSPRTPCRSHPASWAARGQPEPHRHDAGLALGQGAEHLVQLLLQQGEADRLTGLDRLRILDQVAELAVAVLAQRGVQGDRAPGRTSAPR